MTKAVSVHRRYLALYLPWLPAERAIRANAAPPDTGFALVAAVAGANRIAAVSAQAGDGLVGLTLADARGRVPALLTVAHDEAADAALLARLADACERFSPTVALAPPQTVLIDITGCPGAALPCDAVALAARLGLTAVAAVAATPDAATARARFGLIAPAADPADLPVDALDLPAIHGALRRSGLTTIGALAARPTAPLAARFGAEVPVRVARLMGHDDRRLVPRRTPPAILADHRFAEPVVDTDAVLVILDRLIAEVARRLGERGQGGRRFTAQLFRCDGQVTRLTVAAGQPTREAARIARLFRERVASLNDPLDPGFGYDLLRLGVLLAEPLGTTQLGLDGDGRDGAALADLVDRLATRLGPARVRTLARGDSHVPERAAFDRPFAPAGAAWPPPAAGEPPHHPLHLFTTPQPIEVIAEVPDGPPRSFRWHRRRHDVHRAEGPERIAAEWWRDADGRTRDYYRLEDSLGRRFWVFRDGLFGEAATPAWYLHGLFA